MNTTIKKDSGIERILRTYTPVISELAKPLMPSEHATDFAELQHQYEYLLQEYIPEQRIHPYSLATSINPTVPENTVVSLAYDEMKPRLAGIALTPAEITAFLHAIIPQEQAAGYPWKTGLFLSLLIQNSYDAGFPHFVLDTTELPPLDFLGHKNRGTSEKHLRIEVMGPAGNYCASHAQYCEMLSSKEIGNEFGRFARYCTLHSLVFVDSFGHNSDHCIFIIDGRWHEPSAMILLQNATIKSHDEKLVRRISSAFSPDHARFIHIQEDGNEVDIQRTEGSLLAVVPV